MCHKNEQRYANVIESRLSDFELYLFRLFLPSRRRLYWARCGIPWEHLFAPKTLLSLLFRHRNDCDSSYESKLYTLVCVMFYLFYNPPWQCVRQTKNELRELCVVCLELEAGLKKFIAETIVIGILNGDVLHPEWHRK